MNIKRTKIEIIKKNQMELLEVKKKITYKMKNIIHMLNSRLDTTEEQ